MPKVHPGFLAFLALHVKDVEAYLAETYEPLAGEDLKVAISRLVDPKGQARSIHLAALRPVGSA